MKCFTAENYSSVYYQDIAPIIIDGNLSDWDIIKTIPAEVKWIYPTSKPGLPHSSSDLSASFQCLYDPYNLYIAIKVNDDHLVFGCEMFGYSFENDSVEEAIKLLK